jgi:hypothetical protein
MLVKKNKDAGLFLSKGLTNKVNFAEYLSDAVAQSKRRVAQPPCRPVASYATPFFINLHFSIPFEFCNQREQISLP